MTCPEGKLREALSWALDSISPMQGQTIRKIKDALALPPCPSPDPIREAERAVVEAAKAWDGNVFFFCEKNERGGLTGEVIGRIYSTALSEALARLAALTHKTEGA